LLGRNLSASHNIAVFLSGQQYIYITVFLPGHRPLYFTVLFSGKQAFFLPFLHQATNLSILPTFYMAKNLISGNTEQLNQSENNFMIKSALNGWGNSFWDTRILGLFATTWSPKYLRQTLSCNTKMYWETRTCSLSRFYDYLKQKTAKLLSI
jgi:hypothetical protein